MINLDKSKKYEIVGSPKCGTSSLGEHMRRLGYDVIEHELRFSNKEYAEQIERIPIIITRNPVERAWSDFNYFKRTLKESCEWSKYEKYIKLWKNPIIFKLEELKELPDFPCHNENITKPQLDEQTRDKIIMEIEN